MWRLVCLALCLAWLPAQDVPESTHRRVTVPLHENHLDVAELVRALLAAYELDGDAFDLPTARIDLGGTKGTLLLYASRKVLLGTVRFQRNFRAQQLVVTIDRERAREVRRQLRERLAGFAGQLTGKDVANRQYELSLPVSLDAARPLVVLVHGVEGDAEDFSDLRAFLDQSGCQTATFEFPNDEGAERIAAALSARLRALGGQEIAIVGHSFGGLVARAVVEDPKLDPGNVRTVVLLGAPNLGSELAGFRFALEAFDVLVGKDGANLFAQNLLDAVIDHWRDGLGEAGGDLSPGSVFLLRLAARPRNPRVDYHAVVGTRSVLRRSQLMALREEVKRRLAGSQVGQLVRPRLERWLLELDEVVDGEGDGAVSVASARLEGAENVLVPLDHLGLVRLRGLLGSVPADDHPVFERLALWVAPATAVELRGRVVDVLGDPVPAAAVWLTRDDEAVLRRTVADGQGLFQVRLPAVDRGVRVHASAAGKAMAPTVANSPNVVLVMLDAAAVTGVVLDAAGSPVPGADVVVTHYPNFLVAFAAFAASDATGAFRLPAVPVGRVLVLAWSQGRSQQITLDLRGDATVNLRFVDEPVRSRLLAAPDLPASRRACAAFTVKSSVPLPPRLRRLPLREDGTALLSPLPIAHEVALVVPGMTVAPEATRCEAGADDDLEFRAAAAEPTPALTASGKLADATGAGLANLEFAAIDLRTRRVIARGRTGAAGSFSLTRPRSSTGQLDLGFQVGDDPVGGSVDAFGWRWTSVSGASRTFVYLGAGGSLQGTALVRGEPLVFAEVVIERVDVDRRGREAVHGAKSGTTDGRGQLFVNGLAAGRYRVTVRGFDGTVAQADAEVQEGKVAELGAFAPVATGRIEGRLLDAGGQPMAGAPFRWSARSGARQPAMLGVPGITDRDGRFRMRGLLPGDYTLRLGPTGAQREEVQVVEGAVTVVEMRAPR